MSTETGWPHDERFRFVVTRARTVHILPANTQTEVAPIKDGQDFAASATGRTRMLCGHRCWVDWTESSRTAAHPVGEFNDEDLCRRCMRALGPDAYRVFEQRLYEEIRSEQ